MQVFCGVKREQLDERMKEHGGLGGRRCSCNKRIFGSATVFMLEYVVSSLLHRLAVKFRNGPLTSGSIHAHLPKDLWDIKVSVDA